MTPQVQEFRAQGLKFFEQERANIDAEFLPFLARINALPYVLTSQCCAGHVWYTENGKKSGKPIRNKFLPRRSTGRWGYLHLAVTQEAGSYLHEEARANGWEAWIWIHGSQLFAVGAKRPCVIEEADGWGMLGFAWDAKHWPRPAKDITEALEAYVGA